MMSRVKRDRFFGKNNGIFIVLMTYLIVMYTKKFYLKKQ